MGHGKFVCCGYSERLDWECQICLLHVLRRHGAWLGFDSLTATNQNFIQMPRLADMLNQSVNNSNSSDMSLYIWLAYKMQVDVQKAYEAFQKNGRGYIYAHGGFVMPDTPYMRHKMTANFNEVVIVKHDGSTWVRKVTQNGAINRRYAINAAKKEMREVYKLERGFMDKKRLESMFKDAQGSPSPKRSGKANSHDDIGKYTNRVYKNALSANELRIIPTKFH